MLERTNKSIARSFLAKCLRGEMLRRLIHKLEGPAYDTGLDWLGGPHYKEEEKLYGMVATRLDALLERSDLVRKVSEMVLEEVLPEASLLADYLIDKAKSKGAFDAGASGRKGAFPGNV